MSGRNLREMEASDMLDVLHFLFEEDFTNESEEAAVAKSAMRTALYKDMYGVKYSYQIKSRSKGNSAAGNITDVQHISDYESLDSVQPFDPTQGKADSFGPRTGPEDTKKSKVKFVDASNVRVEEHFSSALDAPLG